MSVSGGPDIVQDGLVLMLDVANPRSYVSGSNTWYDLSGNNKHFSLETGIGYSPLYNGELQFPGGENMVSSSIAVTNDTNCTVQIWTRTIDTTGLYLLSEPAASYYVGAYSNSGIYYENNSGAINYKINNVSVSSPAGYLDNQYFCLQMSNINFSNWTVFRIGNYGGVFSYSGNIAHIAIYNRNLTEQESLQNFNAQRSRFGV